MPKAEIRLTAKQWVLCRGAVGRVAVPQDETSQQRQRKLYTWMQFTKDEEVQIRAGGAETEIVRHMAGGMKRRLVAIMTDFAFQGWRQAVMVEDVEPTLAVLGWLPEYDDEDDEEDDDDSR